MRLSAINQLTRLPPGGGSLLWIIPALCLAFTCVFPARMLADPPPNFTDPEVNAYVVALGSFRDRYKVAANAAAHGDDRELKRLDAEFPALQDKAVRLLDKLKPNEIKPFSEYVSACGQAIVDAAYGLDLPRPPRPH